MKEHARIKQLMHTRFYSMPIALQCYMLRAHAVHGCWWWVDEKCITAYVKAGEPDTMRDHAIPRRVSKGG